MQPRDPSAKLSVITVKKKVESDAHARCGALNFNGDVQSYDARSRKHFDQNMFSFKSQPDVLKFQ